MMSYGVREIQANPLLMKTIDFGAIVDKKAHTTLGYFISSKYESYISPLIQKIDHEEKISKLHRLQGHQDQEWCDVGIDDGL